MCRLLKFWNPQPHWGLGSCLGLYKDCFTLCCVLSGRRLCDWPITRPEGSHQMWCVFFEKPYRGSLGPLWVLRQEKGKPKDKITGCNVGTAGWSTLLASVIKCQIIFGRKSSCRVSKTKFSVCGVAPSCWNLCPVDRKPAMIWYVTQNRNALCFGTGVCRLLHFYLAGCTTFPHLPAPIWQLYYLLLPFVSVIPVFFH